MDTSPNPVSQDERTQSMLCWLLSIVIGFISPLIFYLIAKEDKPFLKASAAHCLAFQIVMVILYVILFILSIVTCGLGSILYLGQFVIILVVCIMAGIKANEGVIYQVPLTANLARSWFKV